ncbi:PREDICTED: neuropeptide-like protein C4orf48-like [Elephantulus edwardii]|uniref:neuropeptide-like protein C4orf48-like n=1 Tax=Elephantulus edwardii TaxID=28737 RepID=UPI0003F0AFF8|nr:PREDICTED: neuropeptide-like protein C4orf48-like [Elephantulus edwardii]
MAPSPPCRSLMSPLPPFLLLLLGVALLGAQAPAEPAAGSPVPAQSRPCVHCHAFEFMQGALQDLRKTAYSLDTRTETLLLQAERRALCACWPAAR